MQIIIVKKIIPHQNNVRFSKFGSYKTKTLKDYEKNLLSQFDSDVFIPNDVPLKLDINLCFKIPKVINRKTLKKQERINLAGNYKTTKMDLDNSIKSIQDCISEFYEFDDSNIVIINATKRYVNDIDSKTEYFEFELTQLDNK